MQYPEIAAHAGAGKSDTSRMSCWPILANWYADSPPSSAISANSAPAEKKRSLPEIMRGRGSLASCSIASVSARTHARVRRLVPSSERRRKMKTAPSSFKSKYGEAKRGTVKILSCYLNYVPSPVRLTLCGLPPPVSATEMDALRKAREKSHSYHQTKIMKFAPFSPAGNHPLPEETFLRRSILRRCDATLDRVERVRSIAFRLDTARR